MHEIGLHQSIAGPALLVDSTNTVLIEPGCSAVMEETSLVISVGKEEVWTTEKEVIVVVVVVASHPWFHAQKSVNHSDAALVDSVLLSVFAHRFMSIAEQMGRTLQRTSVSTNIKERKDFSCALFGPTGGLVEQQLMFSISLSHVSWTNR